MNNDSYSIKSIRDTLSRHGFKFTKSLGQNFLTRADVCSDIAENARDCGVLEIGPGLGALTCELAERAKKVVAIEIDTSLKSVLEETTGCFSNVEIIFGDVLKTSLAQLAEEKFPDMRRVVCANLPYYISTPIITALLESHAFSSITVMLQKEVAERICAPAGKSGYGAFSVYVRYYANPSIQFIVPRDCFIPSPKVDSAVVRLDVRDAPPVDTDRDMLFKTVRAAFSQRRKLMSNCLSSFFGIDKESISEMLKNAGYSENLRGETLDIYEFAKISEKLAEMF